MTRISMILILVLLMPLSANAHKARFFAYVEDGEVVCEGGFPGGRPCKECPVIVYDAAAGTELLRVPSDTAGVARFPLTDDIKQARFGLKLVLNAGEGHRGEWLLDPEEYLAVEEVPAKPAEPSVASARTEQEQEAKARTETAVDTREIERIISESLEKQIKPMLQHELEAKLGPIRRHMAEAAEGGPSFTSILGGIGWIVGVAGLLAWFRSRQG